MEPRPAKPAPKQSAEVPDEQRCESRYNTGENKGKRCTSRGGLRQVGSKLTHTFVRLCDRHAQQYVDAGMGVITLAGEDPRKG